jgi:hypothetical protein
MPVPLQVYLEDADFERLDRWSRERGWTKSQAVRAAIRALTRERAESPLLEMSGMIDGLPPDLAENFDRYLNETFVARERSPRYGGRRRGASTRSRR